MIAAIEDDVFRSIVVEDFFPIWDVSRNGRARLVTATGDAVMAETKTTAVAVSR